MTQIWPIADLHCDLLYYLQRSPAYTAYDLIARCAIPQLRQGNVFLQTMANFNYTGAGSSKAGLKQAEIFQRLPISYPTDFIRLNPQTNFEILKNSGKIGILAAIENASTFCDETEGFEDGLKNFESIEKSCGPILYVSLTWKHENRFGGGDETKIGLKPDGERFLDFLSGRKIALDFSHTSDWLAEDIFRYVDKCSLQIPVLASHSNFREIKDVRRNLPENLAREILRREGLIGMNIIRGFVGDSIEKFNAHLQYAIENLAAQKSICMGADFFYDAEYTDSPAYPFFFDKYGDASMYPCLFDLIKGGLAVNSYPLERVAFLNVVEFLERLWR